ncbi:alcohol dehydrogenase catalytic domain-containing protein [Sulfitobacter sp. D35]|uniref:alcohol dehydrogenase catalytic domain-containing protein n=1 Tax=Sulfitobacter sp. D35 TaxID=3083252 RepID=UPI0029700B52|nr:alcohol dehydrogenase catalytic domain-containing protein [Sulfitobacter sp. D35]MDW4498885.1 alcohol dehydrogenase catalytic domain-containing protein [Sulfitobacter sp. D35]
MRGVVFSARETVALKDLPDPEPGPGEVLIEVRASGICHTDFEVLRGNYGASDFPLVPGHEYAGLVRAVGDGVADVTPGMRVVVDPNVECGTCPACARGWAHLCDTLGAYGVDRDGGFAHLSVVRASALHPIGDMAFDVAALAEPMGCVLNGLGAVRAEHRQSALIFGAGPIGLLLAVGLRGKGVENVTLVDIDEARLTFAAGFGFRPVVPGSAELTALERGVDLVVDATGVPAVAQGLTAYIANGGAGLFFGVCPSDARIEVSPFELFRRQITLAGSHSLNHNIPEALDVLRAFGPGLEKLVSHRLALDEVAAILADKPPHGSLKVQAVFD